MVDGVFAPKLFITVLHTTPAMMVPRTRAMMATSKGCETTPHKASPTRAPTTVPTKRTASRFADVIPPFLDGVQSNDVCRWVEPNRQASTPLQQAPGEAQ